MQFSPFSLDFIFRFFLFFFVLFFILFLPGQLALNVYHAHRKHDGERTTIKIGLVKNMYMAISWTSISMQYLKKQHTLSAASNTKKNNEDRWLSHPNNINNSNSSESSDAMECTMYISK